MIKEDILALPPDELNKFIGDFLGTYFEKGFGLMNKTEIETLLYHTLKKYNILSGKCFDDSIKLKTTEAKVRKLSYEAQIKYGEESDEKRDLIIRNAIGECLTHAYFAKGNKEIRFAIEDKYIRVALNAKLRANYYFADTSFNKDIISLDEQAFCKMIELLVPNYQKEELLEKLNEITLSDEIRAKESKEIIKEFIKQLMVKGSLLALKQVGKLLITAVTTA